MVVAIGQRTPSVRCAVLLVEAAVEVAAPAPLLGSDHERGRIDGFDPGREVDRLVADLVHRGAGGPDVAVGGMPDARLVVEDVVAEAAGRVGAPPPDQVLDPRLLKRRARRDVGVVGIVAGHELAVRAHAVAGIGEPLPVAAGLRAVLRDRKAGELVAIRRNLGDPFDGRDGQHRGGAGGARVGDEGVAALAGRGAAVGDALVVPVVAAVVRVQLPVVARRVVAAVAIQRHVEVGELRGGGVGDAVDVGIDGAPAGAGIDGDRHRRILRRSRQRPQQAGRGEHERRTGAPQPVELAGARTVVGHRPSEHGSRLQLRRIRAAPSRRGPRTAPEVFVRQSRLTLL